MAKNSATSVTHLLFASTLLLSQGTATAVEQTASLTVRVPIQSVTQASLRTDNTPEICWPAIVSDRTIAEREEAAKSWFVRHWQQILGGLVGAAAGYQLTTNYSPMNKGWTWPTTMLGTTLGVIGLPGFASLAYGGGALGMTQWPGKLPLTIALSLGGGAIGAILWKMLFPPNPLLQKPGPGEYMADQSFTIETHCAPNLISSYKDGMYDISYYFNGKEMTSTVQYYPGAWVEVDQDGLPVSPTTAQ